MEDVNTRGRSFLFRLKLRFVPKNSVPVTFTYIWYFKRVIIVATKFEKSKVFLIVTIWLPSPFLKLPIL